MFGKIKNKLKDVFKSSEDIIEDDSQVLEEIEAEKQTKKETSKKKEEPIEEDTSSQEKEVLEAPVEPQEEKKGFLGRMFSKKEDKEVEEIEEIEDEMLEGVDREEKEAIEKHKELPKEEIEEHITEVEHNIEKEEELEKEASKDFKQDDKIVEKKLSTPPQKEKEEIEDEIPVPILEENQTLESSKTEKETQTETPNTQNSYEESSKGAVKVENSSVPCEEESSKGFFSKTFDKLKSKKITDEDFDKIWVELEIFLIEINIAYEIVEKIEQSLREALLGQSFNRFKLSERIREVLIEEVQKVLISREANLITQIKELRKEGPVRIMVLGVNGTGKTTSIAKIIHLFKEHGLSVVVAAADTYRAAAVEQLSEHCKNLDVKLISHKGGSDPAAVAFDGVEHAKAKDLDVVLIDTAGRMPNNSNLMMELEKIKRVSESNLSLFVGDSISGNDLTEQIELFNKGVGITGVILTKVDTDERPGSVVTTAYTIKQPIFYLGVGQNYEDLIKFDAKHIAEKLFEIDDE